jgi:hypothetical protein
MNIPPDSMTDTNLIFIYQQILINIKVYGRSREVFKGRIYPQGSRR